MDTYDFASKHLYRARRETAIDRLANGNPYTRRVAYLDTGEALDTIAYLRRGYQPQNLYAINRNPAEVAVLTKKLKSLRLPSVQTIGLDFEEALQTRIPDVDVIDFDGMGCLSINLVHMLKRIALTRRKGVYCITLLGGRESNSLTWMFRDSEDKILPASSVKTSFGTDVNENHARRLHNCINALCIDDSQKDPNNALGECIIHLTKLLWDSYMSISKQPMVWGVVAVEPHTSITAKRLLKLRQMKSPLLDLPACVLPKLTQVEFTAFQSALDSTDKRFKRFEAAAAESGLRGSLEASDRRLGKG